MSNDTGVPYVFAGDVLSVAITLPVAGIISVALRFWIRTSRKEGIRYDDLLICAALIFETGMSACLIYGVAKGAVGYHTPPLPVQTGSPVVNRLTETTPKEQIVFLVYWVVWILMIPTNGLIKLSATLLYRRIFVVAKGGYFDYLSKSLFVVCLLWTIAFFFAELFGCGKAFCKNYYNLGVIGSCNNGIRLNGLMLSDLLTDIPVWLMPVVMVWRLQMKFSRKSYASAILSLAAMSVIAAIVRIVVEFEIAYGGYGANVDDDLVLTINLYWSMLESGLAVIAACLPIICMPLYHLTADSLMSAARSVRRRLSASNNSNEAPHLDARDILCQISIQNNSTICDSTAIQTGSKNGNEAGTKMSLGGIIVEKKWNIEEELRFNSGNSDSDKKELA